MRLRQIIEQYGSNLGNVPFPVDNLMTQPLVIIEEGCVSMDETAGLENP